MSGHGHSHGGGGSCGCDHADSEDGSSAFNLYQSIYIERVECLNEAVEDSGKFVFKPWHERNDRSTFVESDADEELLFKIPFTGNVRLKSVMLVGGEAETHPKTMRLFRNRPGMTFDDTGCEAEQEFELARDESGVIEYAVKASKFNSLSHLCIHFPENYGSDSTKIYYIGLKGDFLKAHREEIVIVNYELNANPADHKNILQDHASHAIS